MRNAQLVTSAKQSTCMYSYMYMHLYMYIYMYVHVLTKGYGNFSTTQQKGKATQHNSPETVIFILKLGAPGGIKSNLICIHVYIHLNFLAMK